MKNTLITIFLISSASLTTYAGTVYEGFSNLVLLGKYHKVLKEKPYELQTPKVETKKQALAEYVKAESKSLTAEGNTEQKELEKLIQDYEKFSRVVKLQEEIIMLPRPIFTVIA